MAKKTNREKGFVFYYSWEKIVMLFEDADAGKLFKALLHVRDNPSPETLPKAVQVAYLMIADQILRDADKYAETCERRRQAANQRWHPEKENTDPAVGDTEETNLDATDANALDAVQTSPTDAKENTNAKKKEKKIENAMENRNASETEIIHAKKQALLEQIATGTGLEPDVSASEPNRNSFVSEKNTATSVSGMHAVSDLYRSLLPRL